MVDYIKAMIDLYTGAEETEELEGQGMVEYGLILVLVSIVAIAALFLLGDELSAIFSEITGVLEDPDSAGN